MSVVAGRVCGVGHASRAGLGFSKRGVMTMAEVSKTAGVTAWTGSWRLPTDKRDHQRAVRRQRRQDRRAVASLRKVYGRR